MNRFEALHTLGLEEGASDEEIRLAYYGIERSVDPNEYADIEAVRRSAQGLLERAKQSRDYLLNMRANKSAAQVAFEKAADKASGRKKASKLSITATQDKTARLNGLEKVRLVVIRYLDRQRTTRNACIGVIAVCIILSFVVLRYVRAMQPRIVVFGVIAIAAVIASTLLTTSLLGVRKSKAHVIEIDGRIDSLKRDLGILPEEDAEGVAGTDEPATAQ